jgi:hypothetical protein
LLFGTSRPALARRRHEAIDLDPKHHVVMFGSDRVI